MSFYNYNKLLVDLFVVIFVLFIFSPTILFAVLSGVNAKKKKRKQAVIFLILCIVFTLISFLILIALACYFAAGFANNLVLD